MGNFRFHGPIDKYPIVNPKTKFGALPWKFMEILWITSARKVFADMALCLNSTNSDGLSLIYAEGPKLPNRTTKTMYLYLIQHATIYLSSMTSLNT